MNHMPTRRLTFLAAAALLVFSSTAGAAALGVTTTKSAKADRKGQATVKLTVTNPNPAGVTPTSVQINTTNLVLNSKFPSCPWKISSPFEEPASCKSVSLGAPTNNTVVARGTYRFTIVGAADGFATSESGDVTLARSGKSSFLLAYKSGSPVSNIVHLYDVKMTSKGFVLPVMSAKETHPAYADILFPNPGSHYSLASLTLDFVAPAKGVKLVPLLAKKSKGKFRKPRVSVVVN